jgi:arsenate reductase
MYSIIEQVIAKINFDSILAERKTELEVLSNFIRQKRLAKETVNLNFICTHNSRRSQFSQIWAQVAAHYFKIPIHAYSGGVEVTAFNERAVESLKRFGFQINSSGAHNPQYSVSYSQSVEPIIAFSKLLEDASNPTNNLAAIMTCSHADDNCPFVIGSEQRIPIRYEDPKYFDDSPLESAMYDTRSFQIASELFYVFSIL